MASAAVVKVVPPPGHLKELPAEQYVAVKGVPLAGFIKELPAEQYVAVKGGPLAGYIKELPFEQSVAVKGTPLAGYIKELPAEQFVTFKRVPLTGVVKELPAAPSAAEKSAAEKTAASPALLLDGVVDTKGAPSLGDNGDDDKEITTEKPIGKDIAVADDHHRALGLSAPKIYYSSGAPMNLSQLMARMEDVGAVPRARISGYGWWVSKEDDDALQLKVAMPGLTKEHVKVSAEKNILMIKGEGDKDPEDGDSKGPVKYNRHFQLPAEAFKMDQIKAEMNNGVLKVTFPKIKDEERKDVFQIKVE